MCSTAAGLLLACGWWVGAKWGRMGFAERKTQSGQDVGSKDPRASPRALQGRIAGRCQRKTTNIGCAWSIQDQAHSLCTPLVADGYTSFHAQVRTPRLGQMGCPPGRTVTTPRKRRAQAGPQWQEGGQIQGDWSPNSLGCTALYPNAQLGHQKQQMWLRSARGIQAQCHMTGRGHRVRTWKVVWSFCPASYMEVALHMPTLTAQSQGH